MRVHSVVDDFVAFWDEARDEPRDVQRMLWRTRYEEANRDLFDVYYSHWASPEMLDDALDRFAAGADAIAARAGALPQRLTGAARAVADLFEAPEPELDVVLLVGLFSSDGWVTEFRGRHTLFLAVEYLPQPPHDDVFLAHECTHVVHAAANPRFDEERVARALFSEGLAVVACERLAPGRSEGEYLWMRDGMEDWVAECERRWPELCARLRADLDSGDEAVYAQYFFGRSGGDLPPRCGYFVGRRAIAALADEHPLPDLARWSYARVRASLDGVL